MIFNGIGTLVIGTIAGFLARAIVPGRDDIGLLNTILLGVGGSLLGGLLGYLLFERDAVDGAFQSSGFFGSVVGAVIALIVFRLVMRRPGAGETGDASPKT